MDKCIDQMAQLMIHVDQIYKKVLKNVVIWFFLVLLCENVFFKLK